MEDPRVWTILVSSLSVANLEDPDRTWQFLRRQGLVVESPTGSEELRRAIATEKARGRITGGTLAFRVAEQLVSAGLTERAAVATDPLGKLAAGRWQAFANSHPGSGAA